VVLVAAGTVRAEGYGPSRVPVAVVTRSCRLDWESPFFTAPVARPIVVTVAGAPPDALARPVPGPASLRLCSVCEQDGFLFLRYRPGPGR
jgi:riboflavin biosynthesis pyrimidine reductase